MKRASYLQCAPKLMQHLFTQEQLLNEEVTRTLDTKLWELVKLRASQLNQCGYCIVMHSRQAMEQGESAQRIIALNAWRDMSGFTAKERLALTLCEQLTNAQPIDDTLYCALSEEFSDDALVTLTVAINAINAWNRVVKMFKPEPDE
ncbi:carboxymuconolactone decarboxylase family protein [Pseudoalteromonas rubra]|uniref:carboxymuconolactone decarboxylase family protein n=1 Tax=Pseudoalteromonas rubra TaxID=43658 RepID=UPI002DBD6B20|nr:carboxymuconolactone decarboxylase family protein [Pseudoalteromonas rubra]MEC4088822.1 carboxymuconolactone decarboxylase family protein [Pseudoalteromonas rubra]